MEWLIPYKIDEDVPSDGPKVAPSPSTFSDSFLQACWRMVGSAMGRADNSTMAVGYKTNSLAYTLGGAVTSV